MKRKTYLVIIILLIVIVTGLILLRTLGKRISINQAKHYESKNLCLGIGYGVNRLTGAKYTFNNFCGTYPTGWSEDTSIKYLSDNDIRKIFFCDRVTTDARATDVYCKSPELYRDSLKTK